MDCSKLSLEYFQTLIFTINEKLGNTFRPSFIHIGCFWCPKMLKLRGLRYFPIHWFETQTRFQKRWNRWWRWPGNDFYILYIKQRSKVFVCVDGNAGGCFEWMKFFLKSASKILKLNLCGSFFCLTESYCINSDRKFILNPHNPQIPIKML